MSNSVFIVASSDFDKKNSKINSKLTKISKLNSKFTKISKINSKFIAILNSKINSKFSSFLSMVDEVNISLENLPESHKFCRLGIHIEL